MKSSALAVFSAYSAAGSCDYTIKGHPFSRDKLCLLFMQGPSTNRHALCCMSGD